MNLLSRQSGRAAFFAVPALMVAALLPLSAATLARGPYVQKVQPDRVTIVFTSKDAGIGSVTFTDGGVARSVRANHRTFRTPDAQLEEFHQYQVELTDLKPGTTYQYQVLLNGEVAQQEPGTFRTTGSGPFSFLALGDSGYGSEEQLALAKRMAAEKGISLVLHTGDLAYDVGSFDEFEQRYFAVYRALMMRVPFFPTPGNHDYYTEGGVPFLAGHTAPDSGVPVEDQGRYYSFDWGDVHFVSLDSNQLGGVASDRMMAWFERDMQTTMRFWKVLYFHHTPFPSGHHVADAKCALARQIIVPAAERNGVQLVLNGHEHSYQRSLPLWRNEPVSDGHGIVYINTSGGGAPLQEIGYLETMAVAMSAYHYLRLDVAEGELTVHAIGMDGAELDETALTPLPVVNRVAIRSGPEWERGLTAEVFGESLALREASAAEPRFDLSGTRATLNSRPVPLAYASPRRLRLRLPADVDGSAVLKVYTGNGMASMLVRLESAPVLTTQRRPGTGK